MQFHSLLDAASGVRMASHFFESVITQSVTKVTIVGYFKPAMLRFRQ